MPANSLLFILVKLAGGGFAINGASFFSISDDVVCRAAPGKASDSANYINTDVLIVKHHLCYFVNFNIS